jgi:predicted signal transduction protein with EAL and GGDEF domain
VAQRLTRWRARRFRRPLGGDEFALLVTARREAGCIERFAKSLLTSLSQPFDLDGATNTSPAASASPWRPIMPMTTTC